MKASRSAKVFIVSASLLFIAISSRSSQDETAILLKIAELKSGLNLRYTLSLPSPLSPSGSYPLVVALHYGGKVTPFYSKDFVELFVKPAFQGLEAIIVAPDCPAEGWTNTRSESAVLELILLLMEEYNIDSDRIVITGYSMGGLGAWYMAARHPDLFSAVIPVSATSEISRISGIMEIPVYIIHGEQDTSFSPISVKLLYERQKNKGAEIKLAIIARAAHDQIARFINPLKATIPWLREIWANK